MFASMKTGTKVLAGLAFGIAIAVIVGGVGYWGIGKLSGHIEEIGTVRLPGVNGLFQIKVAAETIASAQRTLLDLDLAGDVRKQQYEAAAKAKAAAETGWKIYEPLPQTAEEAALWKQFVPAWEEWRRNVDQGFQMDSDLDKLGTGNPQLLLANLETFRGDYYKAEMAVLDGIVLGKSIEGLDDHRACNFGKWASGVKFANPQLHEALAATAAPHEKFHAAIKKIKELLQAGKKEEAAKVYETEMDPNSETTFDQFARMIEIAGKA